MKSLQVIKSFFSVERIKQETQNAAYEGCTFSIHHQTFRSRLAKKTPKKQGYFVVFWEKDETNKNQVYHAEVAPAMFVITVIDEGKSGQFLFPKAVLQTKGILRSAESKGKMGLRVYPTWISDLSPNALKTQKWQAPYFVVLSQETKKEDLVPFYFC